MKRLGCFAIVASILTGPGPASAASEIVRGLCQKDGCAEFTIEEKTPMASGPDGQLFRTRVSLFHANAAGRTSTGEENGYVFCSPTRPAVMSTRPDQPVIAFLLAPDEQAPAWQQRSSVNFFAIYFAVCHGPEAGRAAARDRQAAARGLGYHVPLTASRQVTLQRPEDILKPGT